MPQRNGVEARAGMPQVRLRTLTGVVMFAVIAAPSDEATPRARQRGTRETQNLQTPVEANR